MKLLQQTISSPMGDMLLVTDEQDRMRALSFATEPARLHRLLRQHHGDYELVVAAHKSAAISRLQAYFCGDLQALDDIVVASGGSAFQQQVWAALRQIPPGHMLSYGQLAARLGHPSGARAVGSANASNPIAIVVPCHRLVANNGDLRGYAWGLERKRWLLAHEGAEYLGGTA